MKLHILSIIFVLLMVSCNSQEKQKQEPEVDSALNAIAEEDPYEVMHTVFDGNPEKQDVQPILESVMKRHSVAVNDESILNFANMLVELKKSSNIGVSEMEILKHMYQKGDAAVTLAEQGAISATALETTK